MMGELMSKSILYEPLSELAQKARPPFLNLILLSLTLTQFPPYLEKPPNPLSDEDRKRYDLQLDCIRRILAVFDCAGYDDSDAESQRKITELMAEVRVDLVLVRKHVLNNRAQMQNYGTPPAELMGPLPASDDDEGCTST
jgi:peroxin-19